MGSSLLRVKNEKINISRSQKSAETRQKIIDAAVMLFNEYGLDELTVRNICNVAKVSTGTFYHFFISKYDLILQHTVDLNRGCIPDESVDEKGAAWVIIQSYLNLADHYLSMGAEFTTNIYTPKNPIFAISTRKKGQYILDVVDEICEDAIAKGYVKKGYTTKMINHDIRCILWGNTFDWCASNANEDYKENLKRNFIEYFNCILTEEYFKKYPEPLS